MFRDEKQEPKPTKLGTIVDTSQDNEKQGAVRQSR
jgi:hypothetical protein